MPVFDEALEEFGDAQPDSIGGFEFDDAEAFGEMAFGAPVNDPASSMAAGRPRRIVKAERQKANGRFVSTPTARNADPETDRSRTNGRYVDKDRQRIDPPIKRSAETGRFVSVEGGGP